MISLICKQYGIENYTINGDGSIDVNGDVNLAFCEHKNKKLPLNFNNVSGDFFCGRNNLTSLKGCPRWIGDWFDCGNNNLTSLEFGPVYVGTWFDCRYNQLTDNYSDTEIGGDFYTSLKQDGLTKVNYNEWRKLYKRKKILDELYTRNM